MAKLFEKLKGKSLVRQNIKSDYVLETKDLGISFGGLKAAQVKGPIGNRATSFTFQTRPRRGSQDSRQP